jgi:hypothetical protein
VYEIQPIDPTTFGPRKIGAIRHNYHEHPMFRLDALAALAHRLMPLGKCRFAKAGMQPDSPFEHEDKSYDGRSLEEVLQHIEEPGSWLALYNVQVDPEYDRLLREVQRQMQQLVGAGQKIFDVRGFIFISAPPSVTPFHIDRENNFWMQIHGKKSLFLWDHEDRQVVAAPDVEEFIMFGSLHNVRMRQGTLERSFRFDCGPGDGVYFPSTTPHMTRCEPDWVKPGDAVVVSIGMVFYTDVTRRHARTHALNWQTRRLGRSPILPGRSDVIDRIKEPLGLTVVELRRRFRGYKPPPGIR